MRGELNGHTTFFNPNWSEGQIIEATKVVYSEAISNGIDNGTYTSQVAGENVTVAVTNGKISTAYGDYEYTYEDLIEMFG